jgi:YrbI family 3-deoxy-D-manno-octulosonate 8-phosphate phosphatase
MTVTPSWQSCLPSKPALLVLDFDGVLTDNYVCVDNNGVESVRCSKEDSLGLTILRKRGFPVVILSTETSPMVRLRAEKLKTPCISGVADKTVAFRQLLKDRGVAAADVIFVGNDVNDLGCLREAGCGLVVADAHPQAKVAADGILTRPGGQGAVREVCDAILEALGLPGHFNDSDEAGRPAA